MAKSIVGALTMAVLILFAYNSYYFVYKQRKYRVATILLFYVVGAPLTVSVLSYALMLPLDNYCNFLWILAYYGGAFLNMILGIVQASNLSILGSRLHYQE